MLADRNTSRRALRPDPNFDLLLKALYGNVLAYEQEEDALVAARNAAHAQEAAEEAALRRAQRAAQEAAAAASKQRRGPGVPLADSNAFGARRNNGDSSICNGSKRAPEADDVASAVANAPAGKRRRPHSPSPAPQDAAVRSSRRSPPPAARHTHRSAHPAKTATPPSHRTTRRAATASPEPARTDRRSPPPSRKSPHHIHFTTAHSHAASVAGAGSSGAGIAPRGPLTVPRARSARELSLRHPGMVVVQLLPAHCFVGGPEDDGTAGAGSGSGAGSRVSRDRTPSLEKPFLLCPVGWTAAHISQLLSQWLPPRGFGPAAAPLAPADI